MKKTISLLLALFLMAGLYAAAEPAFAADNQKLQIVTTIFPEYDWVVNMLGDHADQAEITLLLDNGVDLHSYQPSVDDIIRISTCDLFIYVGGESDEWVDDALSEAVNSDMIVLNLLEVLGAGAKEEEVVEGMEADHDHDDHDDHDDHHDEPEYDEHVWLSLKNAAVFCDAIAQALVQLDAENAVDYQGNLKSYKEQLAVLDTAYQTAVDEASVRTLLFGDRFPFRYLTDDYGLRYYAAFVGCSAETEASFETIIFLAGKINELDLPAILQIETADGSIARTIQENTQSRDQKILTLDSMQSVTSQDVSQGVSYLSLMEANLSVLKEALL